MTEQKPTILKILFKVDKNGCSWIDRSKRLTNPHLQNHFTDQEWKEFCDNVDSSLNPYAEPEFVRDNAKDNAKATRKKTQHVILKATLKAMLQAMLIGNASRQC